MWNCSLWNTLFYDCIIIVNRFLLSCDIIHWSFCPQSNHFVTCVRLPCNLTQITTQLASYYSVISVKLCGNLRQITGSYDANYFLKTFALHFHPIQNYALCMMNYELNRLSLHHNSPRSIIWIAIKLWLILSLLPSCLHWHS